MVAHCSRWLRHEAERTARTSYDSQCDLAGVLRGSCAAGERTRPRHGRSVGSGARGHAGGHRRHAADPRGAAVQTRHRCGSGEAARPVRVPRRFTHARKMHGRRKAGSLAVRGNRWSTHRAPRARIPGRVDVRRIGRDPVDERSPAWRHRDGQALGSIAENSRWCCAPHSRWKRCRGRSWSMR